MKKILTALFTLCTSIILNAQTTAPVYGLADEREIYYAFINAKIWQNPSTLLDSAMMIIKKDKIISIGKSITIPSNAVVIDLKGKTIYPSFIDAYTDYGQSDFKKERGQNPQYDTKTKGAYSWNQALKPEFDSYRNFVADQKRAAEMRKLGFGSVLTLQTDGIARGSAALVSLGEGKENELIISDRAAACYSMNKGSSTQEYPSSLMGTIALLRQTYYDADWYKKSIKKSFDISLDSWNKNQTLPQLMETNEVFAVMRANRIAEEFDVKYIIKGSGDEYKRIDDLKKAGNVFIIPLNFPRAYDVSNPFDALNVSTAELKHWELAPTNPSALEKAGIRFAFTTYGLRDKKEFVKNIQKAVKYGLSKKEALSAMTTVPASMLNVSDKVGELKPGMLACFFVCTKDFFEKDNVMLEEWISGKRYIEKDADSIDYRGKYSVELDTLKGWNLNVDGDINSPELQLRKDTLKIKVDFERDGQQITLKFELKKGSGLYRLNGLLDPSNRKTISGDGQGPDGRWMKWKATWTDNYVNTKKDTAKIDSLILPGKIWFPATAFGSAELPKAVPVLIKNATVWTNEAEGILTETDVLINNGKILKVGKGINASDNKLDNLQVIDGKGMHLTSGIIDEHSHIAIRGGVNESAPAISSEVRIGDVIDPEDVDIYRQLAGGVTTSHLLHGSANPIGGQTALIKLRWGKSAEAMKFEGADGFIKFALGENVKQVNWGDNYTIRYPQTRMGVEQTYMDAFSRAKEYESKFKNYNSAKDKSKLELPRRNLQLDALVEILNKKRFITCHSYEQAEINMLIHVADTFGFTVNTFTHILEGYKVADKMKKHGAGGSTFSDWWAYKYEVMEAIPYNGAIMHKMGIVTAYNSDDAEMARRLNQEAAKAVKYGGVTEEEAWKFVTLNPAKLLHIDNRTGSIKVGKDADLVLWNDNPLSIYAHPVKTLVDGICYFDDKKDQQLIEQDNTERQRIIRAMLEAKESGAAVDKPTMKMNKLNHCNDNELQPK